MSKAYNDALMWLRAATKAGASIWVREETGQSALLGNGEPWPKDWPARNECRIAVPSDLS